MAISDMDRSRRCLAQPFKKYDRKYRSPFSFRGLPRFLLSQDLPFYCGEDFWLGRWACDLFDFLPRALWVLHPVRVELVGALSHRHFSCGLSGGVASVKKLE